MNAGRSDPSINLQRYLTAFATRDAARAADCFAQPAVLELPTVKPSRFAGRSEIETAHAWAFQNLQKAAIETNEIVSSEHSAMTAGRLTVVCRGQEQIHPFAIAAECTALGLSRVSWYLDSRGRRPWSDRTVL